MRQDLLIHPTHLLVVYKRTGDEFTRPPAKIDFDKLQDTMDRCNREFGDPSKVLGGPKLPTVAVQTKKRRAA